MVSSNSISELVSYEEVEGSDKRVILHCDRQNQLDSKPKWKPRLRTAVFFPLKAVAGHRFRLSLYAFQ